MFYYQYIFITALLNLAITIVLLFSFYSLFFCPQHLVISAFRCRKTELNFNDQWDALIIACLHICFTDHAPLSLVIVCLSERFPLLICLIILPQSHANSRLTQGHTHTQSIILFTFYLKSLVAAKLPYSWFVLVELSQLPSHFSCSYPRIRRAAAA